MTRPIRILSMIDDRSPHLPAVAGLLFTLALWLPLTAATAATDDAWADDWPEEMDLESRIAAVNDGELELIPAADADGAHAHLNRISITADSLEQGWVRLVQCHENLDAVPAAQILFRNGGIRNLAIDSSRNIGRAWVDGHSVQLTDVGSDARLCLQAESRALTSLGDGLYRLRNGPYMRRFLDGYYPMRVALSIDYPDELIRLVDQSPRSQTGFDVRETEDGVAVDATFEGRLVTCFDFCANSARDCAAMGPACDEN
jgi:hypothetical protein